MDPGLLQDLAPSGVIWQLVVLDVAAGWQPAAKFAVVMQQDAPGVDDKDGDGEVAQDLARGNRRMGGHARRPVYPDLRVAIEALAQAILAADDAGAIRLNATARASAVVHRLTNRSATGLAAVEVLLMVGLALGGRKAMAVRMLAAVGLVYLASEALGTLWPRRRPFARLTDVEALVPHTPDRSFPSRHVASGLAMAVIGRRAHPRLGVAMTIVAWLLGVSRVAAGLHYPSDILVGAAVGNAIGRVVGPD